MKILLYNIVDRFCSGELTVAEFICEVSKTIVTMQDNMTDCLSCGSDLSKRVK